MNYEIKNIDPKKFVGLTTRTVNFEEMDDTTSKIPKVWSAFWNDKELQSANGGAIYGVYSDYESDFMGEYNLTAAIEVEDYNEFDKLYKKIVTPEAKYICFSREGDMPNVVFQLWSEIWEFFQKDECEFNRAYTIDFEKYLSKEKVEIYIALK